MVNIYKFWPKVGLLKLCCNHTLKNFQNSPVVNVDYTYIYSYISNLLADEYFSGKFCCQVQ